MAINMKQKQLEILLHDFELLSKTALLQLQIVTKVLTDNANAALYEDAESNEIIIDRLEIKIREEVVFTVFKFTPKASDLRKIITYQDITTNLERVGDMLLNVIYFLRETDLSSSDFVPIKKLLQDMLQYVSEMLRKAIISFSNEDSYTAYQVIEEDDKVDALFHRSGILLQDIYASKELTKKEIIQIINVNSIAHNLERVGDSATNIAESTVYLTEGKDIRHGNKE